MRFGVLIGLIMISLIPVASAAPVQTPINDAHVLRGRFTQQLQTSLDQNPVTTSGRFTAASAQGLLWMMENPVPTTTVITPQAAVQNFGGLVVKLHAKNLARLYTLVSAALAGHWAVLQADFDITSGGDAQHWQKLLTAKHVDGDKKSAFPYVTITVSGSHFVEDIVMTKADGRVDSFHFTDETLSAEPLTANESRMFHLITP